MPTREQDITLTIDAEFKNLLAPLIEGEAHELRKALVEDGCREPLDVWAGPGGRDILIDGHNRYAICQAEGIAFKVRRLRFPSRIDVIRWIVRKQLGRRNLTPEQRVYLIGCDYLAEKREASDNLVPNASVVANRKSAKTRKKPENLSSGQNDHSTNSADKEPTETISARTAREVGKRVGAGEKTVRRAGKYAESLDKIAEVSPAAKAAILSGAAGGNRQQVHAIAALPAEQLAVAAEQIGSGTPLPEALRLATVTTGGAVADDGAATDKVGRRIKQAALRAVFAELPAFNATIRRISEAQSAAAALFGTRHGAYLTASTVTSMLRNAAAHLKTQSPYAVCPYCGGDGCEQCRGSGFVTKDMWQQVPAELRK